MKTILCVLLTTIMVTGYSSNTPLHSNKVTIGIIDIGDHSKNVQHVIWKYSKGAVKNIDVCSLDSYIKCLVYFYNNPVTILNLSVQGSKVIFGEKSLLKAIAKKSRYIVVASGNKNTLNDSEISYPACYDNMPNNFIVVSTPNKFSKKCKYVDKIVEHRLECVNRLNCMKGTSQAAARVSGELFYQLTKEQK